MHVNWHSARVEARFARGKGGGLFAVEPIPAGETVVAFGGAVVPRDVLDALPADQRARSIQIDEHLYLAGPEAPEPGDLVNHSCDPNCGLLGAQLVVAMRDVEVGEEITIDYAMCDASDYDEFDCACDAPWCRGRITGGDWMLPDLQERYDGWFSPYLARRIRTGRGLVAAELRA